VKEQGLYYPDGSFKTKEQLCERVVFPDKKKRGDVFSETVAIIRQTRELHEKFEIGQTEATWRPQVAHPELPLMLDCMTDPHFGSSKSNIDLLVDHLDLVEETDNFTIITDGDDVDNFNATGKWASGMMEDPLPPQVQGRAWVERMKKLDDKGKIGVMGFGNHNDFGEQAGWDWYDTFLGGFKCPVFTSGGLLKVEYGNQTYQIALTHRYWGTSKLNPTNACKRYLEHEYPDADVVMLGHTHQSEGLHFERGGKDRIGLIGGTFKDKDTFARKRGIGGRSGAPGWVLALWPDRRQMQLFKDIDVAKSSFEGWKRYKECGGRV